MLQHHVAHIPSSAKIAILDSYASEPAATGEAMLTISDRRVI